MAEERRLAGDQLAVLETVVGILESGDVPYMVSGSVAMNYYAVPRMTRDIDIVIDLDPSAVDRLVALLGSGFYCDADAVRQAVETRGMFNAIHFGFVIKVDFIVCKASAYREEEFRRRRDAPIDDFTIKVVSPEDLLLSKLEWAKESPSETQLSDAANLARSVEGLDWRYMERWAPELNVGELLRDIRQQHP